MKNICKIHPFFYIVALIYVITGKFRPFIWITSLIVIHEVGHVITGLLFKWKIEKIIIMPFGGITIFNGILNRPIKEELIVALMGPIFQIIYFLIIHRYVNYAWFYNINIALLLFNLLPIIPLDGSKILHCFMDTIFAFQISHKIILNISVILLLVVGILCFIMNNLIIYVMFICILIKVIEEYKNSPLRFQKFLLERYLSSYYFTKTKKIKDGKLESMFRDYNHIFYKNNHWISEKRFLKNHFNIK